MMQRFLVTLLICLVSLFYVNYASSKEYLTISSPPSIWVKKQGDQLSGPIVELLDKIFSEIDVEIRYKSLPWARAIDQMKTGKLDLMPVIFFSDERAEFMDFTVPYANVPTSIFVPAGKSFTYQSLKDLVGKKGLKMRGDSISKTFKMGEAKLNVTEIVSYEQMVKMLSAHRADYAVAAHYGFLSEVKKLGYEDAVESLSKPIASRSLHLAISKKSAFVNKLPLINKRINQLKVNGSIEKLLKRK